MQRRCARQLENCSISTPLPLSKTNLTGRWVVVVVVSRSTFDTTRFQESSKELQVLIKLWKPAVFHTRAPLFLSFLFPTNSSLSLSLFPPPLFFFHSSFFRAKLPTSTRAIEIEARGEKRIFTLSHYANSF